MDNLSRIVLSIGFITCFMLQPTFSQQEMWMSSTDENIIKRASKQPKPFFQIPIGHQHVENMQRVGKDLLLVGLRENSPKLRSSEYLMINSENGKVQWRWRCENSQYSTFWVSDSYVILKADGKKKTTLFSLETESGKLVWTKSFSITNHEFVVNPNTEELITYHFNKEKIMLSSISLKEGHSRWENQINGKWTQSPFVLLDENRVFAFYNGISILDANTGAIVAELDEIPVGELSHLVPSFDDSHLFVVDDHGKLVGIDKANGQVLPQKDIAQGISITNIASTTKHIYVRGETENSIFKVIAFQSNNPNPIWTFESDKAITSNFIENEDILFFASSSKLYALNATTGKSIYIKTVTQTGRNFPIALRLMDELVIYVGELVIAGFKSESGKLAYKHGFSPIDPNLHYNGLDASLPQVKERLEALQNQAPIGVAQAASNQRAYYQKMADKNYSDYLKYRQLKQPGTEYKANMARSRSRMYSNMARMQAGLSLSFAILELGVALETLLKARAAEAVIRKQEYFRKSILEVYNNALSEDYVFRPNLKYFSTPDQYICVSIINLSTGNKENYYLSPHYLQYGLWNLVDFEKRIIYHHGVGMNPSKYQISKSKVAPLVKFKMVETFLIAQPFE